MDGQETGGRTSVLGATLSQADRDAATVRADATPLARELEGVDRRRLPTHVDARGEVLEVYDERWGFHPEPMVYCYQFTVRPGVVKGWGLHKKHDDRYVLLKGKVDLVMYDARAGSPTEGRVQRVTLNEYDRQIVRIPAFVWHADHNYGEEEAVILNFPTQPYDHADPDKWVLPIDTPLIPYDFGPSARAR